MFQLGGHEEIVFELRPAVDNQLGLEGARYTAEKTANGSTQIRVYAPEGSRQTVRVVGSGATRVVVDGAEVPAQSRPGNALTRHFGTTAAQQELAYSPASLRVEGKAGEERTLHVTAAIQVAADYREAKLAFLIEPEQDLRGVKVKALDNGKPWNCPSKTEAAAYGTGSGRIWLRENLTWTSPCTCQPHRAACAFPDGC